MIITEKALASKKFSLAKNWQNLLSISPKNSLENLPNISLTKVAEKLPINQPFLLAQNFQVGNYLEVLWEGNWYLGKILEIKNNQYCITYPTYDTSWDECLGSDRSLLYRIGLIQYLEDLLGRKVDVATVKRLRESFRERIITQAIPL